MCKYRNIVRKVAVVGSGTMGTGIAALLSGAGFPVLLLDVVPSGLTDKERELGLSLEDSTVRNRIVNDNLLKIQQSNSDVFFEKHDVELITTGNLEDDFDKLASVDWVIEAIVENIEVKRDFFAALDNIRPLRQIVSTNTSGLPINELSRGRSDDFRQHFLGAHFFNPPRYMELLEIIPSVDTTVELVEFFCTYISKRLGKKSVLCKDTPSFIANRIGLANNFWRIGYAIENGYTIEEVDSITGTLMGYPSTAVFRLMDLVGLDVACMIGSNINQVLPYDAAGIKHGSPLGRIVTALVERNWIGNKTKIGFYKQVLADDGTKQFWPLDFESMEHSEPSSVCFESINAIRKIDNLGDRLRSWINYKDRASDYVWNTLAFLFSYVSVRAEEISNDLSSIDDAMRWGYMMAAGPFEIWDMLGVADTIGRMETDGYTVAPWVKKMVLDENTGFYRNRNGCKEQYDWKTCEYVPLPLMHPSINVNIISEERVKLDDNEDATLFDTGDGVLQLEFHSKANTIGSEVINMTQAALNYMDNSTKVLGLIIGNQGKMFSAGANIDELVRMSRIEENDISVDQFIVGFQNILQRIRYSTKPVVAAPFNITFGGAAEIVLASSRVVAHVEMRMGLVEVGVGLVPAGGGCKEILRRFVNPHMLVPNADHIPFIRNAFETIFSSKVSSSAYDAKTIRFIGLDDRIVVDKDRLLEEAKSEVLHLSQSNYAPPRLEKIYVGGQGMLALIRTDLFQMCEANHITSHDLVVGEKLGWILSGGDIAISQWVDEQYILDLERLVFSELIGLEKTVDRIDYTLKTGKRLRN
jgi:3-hydroxyacyl-CoA dehydrogenase